MKRAIFTLVCVFVGLGEIRPAPKEAKPETNPEAGGVVINPSEGEISPGDEITITFPNAMVSTDKIDMGDQPAPFVSEPKIEGSFLFASWRP